MSPLTGPAGRVAEGVPDARFAAIFGDGAFDLVGSGGGSPPESGGKLHGIRDSKVLERLLSGFRRKGCATRGIQGRSGRARGCQFDEISTLHGDVS